ECVEDLEAQGGQDLSNAIAGELSAINDSTEAPRAFQDFESILAKSHVPKEFSDLVLSIRILGGALRSLRAAKSDAAGMDQQSTGQLFFKAKVRDSEKNICSGLQAAGLIKQNTPDLPDTLIDQTEKNKWLEAASFGRLILLEVFKDRIEKPVVALDEKATEMVAALKAIPSEAQETKFVEHLNRKASSSAELAKKQKAVESALSEGVLAAVPHDTEARKAFIAEAREALKVGKAAEGTADAASSKAAD
ncbi:unnamed protein product, partial [Prorocentrum cordatum]